MRAQRFFPRAWLIALVLAAGVGTAVAGQLALERHRVDRAARTVAIAVVYGEVEELARRLGIPPEEAFRRLAAAGATAVLAKERGPRQIRDGVALSRDELAVLAAGGGVPARLAAFAAARPALQAFILLRDPGQTRELAALLAAKGIGAEVWRGPDRWAAVGAEASLARLEMAGLGVPVEELRRLEREGWDVLVQLKAREDPYEALPVAPLLEPLARLTRLRAVFYNDKRLPGYPTRLPELVAAHRRLGVPVGVIEGFPQEGMRALVDGLAGRAVRLHPVLPEELLRLDLRREVERYRLAAAERSIRVLLLRVMPADDPRQAEQRLLAAVHGVRTALAAEGFRFGPPSPLPVMPPSPAALAALYLGLGAAVALTGHLAGLAPPGALAGIAVAAAGSGAALGGHPYLAQKLGAALTPLVVPVLAMLLATRVAAGGGNLVAAALGTVAGTAVSVAGGLAQIAFQAHPQFVLRTDVPPGTKLAAVLPPLAVAALAAYRRAGGLPRLELRRVLSARVPLRVLLAGLALLAVAALYVSRTGNQPLLPPTELEHRLRLWLTEALEVRPRFKEFLIGHPALVVALALGERLGGAAATGLLAAGAIGQASVVNAFSHAHTPVAVSLLRAAHGLWLGTAGGLLLAAWARRRLERSPGPAAEGGRSPATS